MKPCAQADLQRNRNTACPTWSFLQLRDMSCEPVAGNVLAPAWQNQLPFRCMRQCAGLSFPSYILWTKNKAFGKTKLLPDGSTREQFCLRSVSSATHAFQPQLCSELTRARKE